MSILSEWKTQVFLPDYQIPFHAPKIVNNLAAFVGDFQPDELFHVGDLIDCTTLSRWADGTALEYETTFPQDVEATKNVLLNIRDVYDGPFTVKRGNHDMRFDQYLARKAPALKGFRTIEDELAFASMDITYARGMIDVAPGWVLAHGDEGSLNRLAGGTAASLASRIGKSVVCGHTHKVALKPAPNAPQGYNGKLAPTLWGMEVGNAMNVAKASYLKTGAAGWQHGLGILRIKGNTVIPQVVPITPKGVFIVDGQVYGE